MSIRPRVLLLFIISIFSFNQLMADGSIYSLRGQGPLFYYPGGRAIAMGGATIGVANSAYLNWLNPASLSLQDHVHISSQFLFQNLNIKDGSEQYKTSYANFNGFMGALGIYKGVGIGFGIQPVSKISFQYESRQEIQDLTYTTRLQKSGGLSRIFLSTGIKLHSKLHLGVGINYIFGKVDEDWRVTFDDIGFIPTRDQYRTKYDGVNAKFGFLATLISGWNIGGIYQTGNSLKQDKNTKYFGPQEQINSLENGYKLPVLWGLGTSIHVKKRFLLAMDYLSQDWGKYASDVQGSVDEFTQMQRFSFGLEYGLPYKMNTPLTRNLRYRLGFSWQQPYYLDFDQNKLSSYTISAGFGIQFDRGAVLDVALEYGKRGKLPNNSFEESIISLSVYISGGEMWFNRK